MRRAGIDVFVHHSAVSREERQLAEERFHHGSDACIVCTSTLELGIDVGDLDRVLQAEAPDTVTSFLQRMGRTGRRPGQASNTTFLCETTEGVLQAIALVELAKAGWVEPVELDRRCWPVLIHQLLAMALAGDGITGDDAWEHLARVPDFQGIHRAEYDRLLAWMVRDGSLRLASGRLVLGPKAERRFGRKNFMELFAVFSSPQTYTVQTASGRPLGSLSQAFVDRLVDGVSSFLLGGRAWAVLQVRHDDRRVVVEAAPRGRQPTWGGFLPQFLGLDLCQRIRSVLLSEARYPYLDDAAWAVLSEQRASMRGMIGHAALLEGARDRRSEGRGRGRRDHGGRRHRGRGQRSERAVGRLDDLNRVSDMRGCQGVRGSGRLRADWGACGARAALPLVGDRGWAVGPRSLVRGQDLAVLCRSGDSRGRSVSGDGRGRHGLDGAPSGIHGGLLDVDRLSDVGGGRGVVGHGGDRRTAGAGAVLPLVRDGRAAAPLPLGRREWGADPRGPGDRRKGGIRRPGLRSRSRSARR